MFKRIVFLGILLFASLSSAQVEKCIRIFRVSTNDYAPLFYLKDNKPAGFTHDLYAEIKKRLGCEFVEESVAAPRAVNDFANYRTDLTGLVPENQMLSQWGEYVPLYRTARILILRKNKFLPNRDVQDYIDNKKLIFGAQIGGAFLLRPHETELFKKQNRLIETPNPTISYKLISDGRIDAFFVSPVIHHYFKEKEKEFRTIRDNTHKLEVGIYLSKKKLNKNERDMIVQAFKDMKADGTLKKLLLPYLDKEDIPYYENL
ncbi:ABC transporter substrate-binding protein [Bdellovibrio sp. NC01]|uniref:substrate-binding periplasmic protein n=1 Tax=Bdellovibrio sp. NC01 TaxID=2220073 RepID=UPI001159B602|nr:transporter substrate-binding domain-containing protein [Bdellovibrio sp. NC01]QDK36685.1 hypothetical protein DOE51_03245 [Bdellovibrio sp. NC01]